MDTLQLRSAYRDLLDVVDGADFGAPPAGEWDAEHQLAHVAAVDTGITGVALAVVAGQRPGYDNRYSLDEWNLGRLVHSSGDVRRLADLVERQGELLCNVVEQLSEEDLDVIVPTLIISNGQVLMDQAVPLRFLIGGLAEIHLPGHADQLKSLQRSAA